jgi:hypothetical protein
MWGEGDLEALHELVVLHHDLATFEGTRGKASLASEVRQREHDLGLTAKGKQVLRWRVSADGNPGAAKKKRSSTYAHLKAVPDAVERT